MNYIFFSSSQRTKFICVKISVDLLLVYHEQAAYDDSLRFQPSSWRKEGTDLVLLFYYAVIGLCLFFQMMDCANSFLLQMKKDDMLVNQIERVPFLEEQVRKIKEGGKLLTMDIERLLLSEDNRFDFINEVAAEANEYVENNRDEYGGTKKAILHVLSNRVNDSGFHRPEAYAESDPFKPGPGYLKEEFT